MDFLQTPSPLAERAWFPVDNAANLYCGSRRYFWARTFRMAFVLNEEIDPALMQQALSDIAERFPSFCANVHDGLFWSYFARNNATPKLQKECTYPGRPMDLHDDSQPNFRVLYYRRRIALEIFHGVADGGSSMKFLSSLVTRYYELRGLNVSHDGSVLFFGDPVTQEETTDPYIHSSSERSHAKNYEKLAAYTQKAKRNPNYMRVIHGMFRVSDVKDAAANYGLTVTEFLSAALIDSYLQTAAAPVTEAVSISIPLDLRRRFHINSIRNFAYMSEISFFPNGRTDISFAQICEEIAGKVQEKSNVDYLQQEINANVRAQKSGYLRPIPYCFKRLFLRNTYYKNQTSFTTFFSNVGEVKVPPEVLPHINRAEFVLGDTPHNPFGCAAVSVGGLMTFSFNDSSDDTEKQRCFFRRLVREGVPVRIETNLPHEV